jgi:hypothetical protein
MHENGADGQNCLARQGDEAVSDAPEVADPGAALLDRE